VLTFHITQWVSTLRTRLRVCRAAWRCCSSLQGWPCRLVAPSQPTRLIVLGDLNTMGQTNGASAAEEIAALGQAARANGMRVLPKTHAHTWSSDGKRMSNLDHVIASSELRFTAQTPAPAEVLVDGWVNRSGEERVNFVKNISDHSLLFGELV
jgi:endonuclease/exonuclease/phosphatase family metal-dependent hydrolase